MHIVHLLDKFRDGAHGGLSTVVCEAAGRLADRGHRVTVIARRFGETVPLRETVDGVQIMRFDSAHPGETFLRARGIVQSMLEHTKIDVLHSHLAVVDAAAVRFLHKTVPVVRSFHGDWPVEVWSEREAADRTTFAAVKDRARLFVHDRIERLSMHRAEKIHVLSAFSKAYVMRKFGRRERDIEIIPPGIDVDRFKPSEDKDALRVDLGLPQRAQIILFAGRLVSWKGPARVVAAFATITDEHRTAELVIAGKGREEAALREQARRLGVADRVHFVGFQKQRLADYYAAADVVIVASTREETFGMVTAEALACGTPVLGTPFGATPEILGDIDERLVLASPHVDDIAEGLRRFFADERRDALAPTVLRDSVARRFSWNDHVDRLVAFYYTLTASR